jgi:hypothetical protein
MSVSRRHFLQTGISASALSALAAGAKADGYRPNLLPSQKEVWDWQVWMAELGPKYTGNPAHTTFVAFLASHLKEFGLDVARQHYALPRWDARRWEITVTPASGKSFHTPVTSYFPYSGQTPAAGATGELEYAGHAPSFKLDSLQGKVALIDFATNARKFSDMYQPWGIYPADVRFPSEYKPARGGVNDLTQFQKAGAIGVILAWTDVSDANAADQYTPFSRRRKAFRACMSAERRA